MGKTTKSPRKVLVAAHLIATDCMRAYSHRFSPRKFTQPQLFAILVLKEFMRCDYRKVTALLSDSPELGQAIGLPAVPHYTTIQKASRRLLESRRARRLLESSLALARKKSCCASA
jgi:hypothetical protein